MARRESLRPRTVMQNGSCAVGWVDAAEGEELVLRDAELLAQGAEVLFDELGAEAVVAGGDGCVGGEDDLARDLAGGLVEGDAFFDHAIADGLEDCEAAVALVEVKDPGGDAHGLECAEAADAEEELLTDAGAAVAAVEARGELEIFGGVAGDVGVEEQEIAAADFDSPHLGADDAAAGLDFDDDPLAVCADGGLHGQLVDVGLEVVFALPAFVVEALEEVSLAVEEADADERDVEVGGALDVVAGEDAEAAGVDGEGLVQAELGGEVGDGARAQDAGVGCAPGAVGVEVFLLAAVGVVDAAVEHVLGGASLDLFERHLVEQRDWILVGLAPASGVRSRKRLTQSWSQLHQRLRASAQRRSCEGAMKRSRVRASLTTGATWLAASTSMRISVSRKTRGSLVCTTRTPCRIPRSMRGTPRKEW